MNRYTEPIHRWCSFADSWPPSAVEQIISFLQVRRDDWIWDPFGGCGTTAVVARTKDIGSITSDIDPLAALVARTKANPPSSKTIEQAIWPKAMAFPRLVAGVAAYSFPSRFREIECMRFLIAASLIRIGWHLGKPFDEKTLRAEFHALKHEMRIDSVTSDVKSLVYHRDFAALAPTVRRISHRQVVMITSPPFPASNKNPQLEKLKAAIGIAKRKDRVPSLSGPRDYRKMLDLLVVAAVQAGCRAVAVELSARGSSSGSKAWPPRVLTAALERAGYTTLIARFNLDTKDPSVLCLGIRDMRTAA